MPSTYLSLHYHLNTIRGILIDGAATPSGVGPFPSVFRGCRPAASPPANGLYPSGMMKPCSRWDSGRCSSRGNPRWSLIRSPFRALFQKICTHSQIPHSRMLLAGIQINNLDTGLRRYDARDLYTHLCGVVLPLGRLLGTAGFSILTLRQDLYLSYCYLDVLLDLRSDC
jgi:hypothetical protein